MSKRTVKDVAAECKVKSKEINNLLFDTTIPNAEIKINDYYSKCAQYDELEKDKDKHSFLKRYYLVKALDLDRKNDFDTAIIYYKKSIEELKLRKKPASNLDFDMVYGFIANCYYNNWKMAEAAQYYEKAIAHGYAVIEFSEKLGDCYHNLGQYDKSQSYYFKTIELLQKDREDLISAGLYTEEKQQEINARIQKCYAIINGTYD